MESADRVLSQYESLRSQVSKSKGPSRNEIWGWHCLFIKECLPG